MNEHRYVRTKDRLYELQETKNGQTYLVRTNELIPLWNTEAYEIIAQADNIKELCDEFVAVFDTMPPKPIICEYSIGKARHYAGRTGSIYGAIWIEIKLPDGRSVWRLEPVAIMNDKGELELL